MTIEKPIEPPPGNRAAEDPDYYPDESEEDNPDEWVAYALQPFNEDDPF